MDKSEIPTTSTMKILFFIPLLQLLLVPASGSGAKDKLFFVDGVTGEVTIGKNQTKYTFSSSK